MHIGIIEGKLKLSARKLLDKVIATCVCLKQKV